jgi:2,3-bisphosphoglycerate-independent phosphoglycerate mutase
LKKLEELLVELNAGKPGSAPEFFIATISGRYYAMDRDHNWDRLAKTEQALFECEGNVCSIKPSAYMNEQYAAGNNDELLEPAVCVIPQGDGTIGNGCAIEKDDAVFFFNFRADRARMLSEKLIAHGKKENIMFVTLTEYSTDFECDSVFPPMKIATTLGQEVSNAGLEQAHIAETEKFAHATYFLNGGREKPYDGERDILLKSRTDVKTHDKAPEMRAEAIADATIAEIGKGTPFIFINFANADMVGHTADVPAIVKAIETVDAQLKRVITALNDAHGIALITADHGNAEINVDPVTGTKHTSHTTSPVPCILTGAAEKGLKLHDGGLSDVAPTILTLLNIPVPKEMTGKVLIS